MLFDAVDRIAAAVAVVTVVENRWWDGNGTFIMVHRDDDIIIIGNIMVRLVARLFLSFSFNYSISRRCNLRYLEYLARWMELVVLPVVRAKAFFALKC